MNTLIPLVVHYSFDSEVPIYFFNSEEEAKKEIKRQFEEEKRIELEENEKVEGKDILFQNADDWSWASIINITEDNDPDDITEWAIGTVYRVPNGYTKSDDLQWARKESDGSFSLVEVRENPDGYIYVAGDVDLKDYTDDNIDELVSGYYKSLADVKLQYPDAWEQVVAECIFEQTSDIELIGFGPFVTEDEAEKAAEDYIAAQKG